MPPVIQIDHITRTGSVIAALAVSGDVVTPNYGKPKRDVHGYGRACARFLFSGRIASDGSMASPWPLTKPYSRHSNIGVRYVAAIPHESVSDDSSSIMTTQADAYEDYCVDPVTGRSVSFNIVRRCFSVLQIMSLCALCACSTVPTASSYKVTIPLLTVTPQVFECRLASGKTDVCIALLRSDFAALVRELKTACLVLGGSPADCQAEESRPDARTP